MNSLSPELRTSYEHVVKDLEGKRAGVHAEVANLQRRLRELDDKIAGLYREIGQPIPSPAIQVRGSNGTANDPAQKYALISVHWAILHLLSEAKDAMTSAEIAEALTTRGVKTKAANFTNNVSAVLTTNMRPKSEEEVECTEGRWKLTDTGRNKAAHVIASAKFRRACPWITEATASCD